jgi:hypothetical protein
MYVHVCMPAACHATLATYEGCVHGPGWNERRTSCRLTGCPPKYGWTARPSSQLVPISGDGVYGVASGILTGGAVEAEAHCRVNPRCTAWDTDGNVAFGGVETYVLNPGVCSYEKARK